MQTFIAKVIENQDLSTEEMREAMTTIMTGQPTPK